MPIIYEAAASREFTGKAWGCVIGKPECLRGTANKKNRRTLERVLRFFRLAASAVTRFSVKHNPFT